MGRADKLVELAASLDKGQAVAISALTGMGGIGKSELALQYALRSYEAQKYPAGICWLDVRGQNAGLKILDYARVYLGLADKIPEGELAAQVEFCYRQWRSGEVLLVFDDVVDFGEIKAYLPPAIESRFKVLLTTRQNLGSPVTRLDLDVLKLADAVQLLASHVGDNRVAEDNETAEKLCEWLGCLPLAIEIMGRYLAEELDLTLGELLQELGEIRLESAIFQTKYPEMTATREVVAAFELSWNRLSDKAQDLARLLSLFAPESIPWELVEATEVFDQRELRKARLKLTQLNLLKRAKEKRYELHPLIREYFQQQQPPDEQKKVVCRSLAQFAKKIEYSSTLTQIAEWEPSIPHLTKVAKNLSDWLDEADLLEPYERLAFFYYGQGLFNLAMDWSKLGKEVCEKRLGAEHPFVATSLNNLAFLYDNQGKYAEAAPLYQRSLSILEKRLGTDHPDVATSLNNLAVLYKTQGKYVEAEPLYRRSLHIWEKHLGADHPDVASSLNNLALLYEAQGKYAEAEPLYRRSLSIYEKRLGTDHPQVATSLNNLAGLYHAQGKYAEAEPFYWRSLSILEKQLGADHPDVAASLNNLAALYRAQEKYAEAEPLYRRSLSIREKQLGADHPDVAQSLNNLAWLYRNQEQYEQALPLYQRAYEIRAKVFGESHPETEDVKLSIEIVTKKLSGQ